MISLDDSNRSESAVDIVVLFLFFFFCFVIIKKVRVNLLRIPPHTHTKSKGQTLRKYILQKESEAYFLGTSRFKLTIKKTNLH